MSLYSKMSDPKPFTREWWNVGRRQHGMPDLPVPALEQLVIDFAVHASWRCYSHHYPGACCCGLDKALAAAGLEPANWAGRTA